MKNFISKIETAIWFSLRPQFYRFGLTLLKRRLFHLDDNLKKIEAITYCQENVILVSDVLQTLNTTYIVEDFSVKYKNQIAEALSKIESAPVQMGGPGDLNLLYNIVKAKQPKNIVETGVAYGWSSLALLAGLHENMDGNLISVDMPYPKMNAEAYVGIAVPKKLKNNWRIINEPDQNGLIRAIKLFDQNIDLCHYDSDKSYSGRMWAYPIIWKNLSEGGIFISDDIQDNIAFVEFSKKVNRKPMITFYKDKYVGALMK